MRRGFAVALFVVWTAVGPGIANSCPICPYPSRGTKIFEPKQNALIAWNGKREILSLALSMKASEPVEVLRVLPFPSEPKIGKSNPALFDKAVNILNGNLMSVDRLFSRDSVSAKLEQFVSLAAGGFDSPPPGVVTFHERIGVHDITTVKLMNVTGFTDWVEKYFLSKGFKETVISDTVKSVINDYIKEGMAWFVFDAVSIEKNTKQIEILQYAFDTDSLYYPLKIAKTVEGETDINLIVITPNLLSQFSGIGPGAGVPPGDRLCRGQYHSRAQLMCRST